MKIIILSQWYPPENETRIHLLAKSLVSKGHHVVAITGFPNYPSGRIFPGYKLRWRQREILDGVKVLRVPLFPSHDNSIINRFFNYLTFALSASTIGAISCGDADAMWVYHPPLSIALPALIISKLRHIPFIYEVQDLWPETLKATGILRSKLMLNWIDRVATFIYRRAEAITVISKGFRKNLISKGLPGNKIHVIPNWADESIYRPVPREADLADEHGLKNRFNVVYGGNIGSAQILRNVICAAELLYDIPEIQIVIIGDGVERSMLEKEARDRKLSNVRFIPPQPAQRMPSFFSIADALLVHLRNEPLFAITIPGKTTAYMACGKPIICCVAGDAAEMILQAGAGLIVPPEDPEALANSIRKLYRMSREEREAFGRAGREAFQKYYSREVLFERYLELIKAVMLKRKRA